MTPKRSWWTYIPMGALVALGFLLWPSVPPPRPLPPLTSRPPATKAQIVVVAGPRASSAAQQTSGERQLEVCHGGYVPPGGAPSAEAEQQEAAATKAREKRLVEALSAGALPETRALGAWLAHLYSAGEARSPYIHQTLLCKGDLDCMKALSAEERVAVEKAARPQVDEMVRQAVDSSSPGIYAMAINVCNPLLDMAPSPSCQLITAERWTQIDPDNAGPWIHLAHEAVARHDTATADEALYRASVARSFRSGRESLLNYAEPALAKGFSEADRSQLEWDVWVAGTALFAPMTHDMVRQCDEDAVKDSSRRQTCDAFATLLLERSSDLIDFHIGVRMAERLGWPAERLAALQQEREALDFASTGSLQSEQRCEPMRRFMDRVIQGAPLGELGRTRAWIAASGKSYADLARLAQVRKAESAKAESPASAASGS